MARMIPPIIDPDTPSPGEIEVFRRLKEDPLTADWTVLHSLEVAHHRTRIAGEIDFVVVIPDKGVLCVEVKAHSCIRCLDGQWLFGRREDAGPSPFKQASAAMHSIRALVTKQLPSFSHIPFWSCVVLPYVEFPYTSAEWHSWQLIDSRAFRARSTGSLLLSVITRARQYLAGQPGARWFRPDLPEPDSDQCKAIVHALRPLFEAFESPKARRERADAVMKRYTDDQIDALDAMEQNPRVVFTGPAGTGKTLLAIEAARRSHDARRKILLVCFNDLLAHWLEAQVAPLRPWVTVRTLHKHMLRVAGEGIPVQAQSRAFWQDGLPTKAIERLLDASDSEFMFDELVVDEAQDLLRDNYLDFLDLSVKGGLASGRLRLFGDFEKQALYDAADISLDQFKSQRCPDIVAYSLRTNCRNTPRVAALVRLLCDLQPDYKRVLRPDDHVDPRTRYYKDAASQERLLIETLETLNREKFSASEIVVLSAVADHKCVAAGLTTAPWRDRLRPFKTATPEQVRYCTIHAFKGMEAPAVVVSDITSVADDSSRALFYVAVTRALHRLVMLASDSAKTDILRLLER